MQKITLALSAVALLLAAYAAFLKGDDDAAKAADANTFENARMQDDSVSLDDADTPKVAYVRGDSLNLGYQFFIDKQDEMINSTRQSESKLQRQLAKAEGEYQELVKYAQSGQATDEELQIAQQRMMELEYELQAMQQQEQERLLRKEQEFQAEITGRITAFLDRYAKENDIDLILNWGISGEGVLYGSQPYDITRQVVAGLNAEYALQQEKAEKE